MEIKVNGLKIKVLVGVGVWFGVGSLVCFLGGCCCGVIIGVG